MTQTIPLVAKLGPGKTGLTVSYVVYELDETTVVSSGTLAEKGSTGEYTLAGGATASDAGGYWNATATGIDNWGSYPAAPVLKTDSRLDNLDAAVSSRATQTDVTAIKAKTDQLTFTVANQVDANALSGGFAAADRTKLDEVYIFRRLDAAKPLTTDRNGNTTTETDGTITITHTVNPTTETVSSVRTG